MKRLTEKDLQSFIQDYDSWQSPALQKEVRLYALAGNVLCHYIGLQWVNMNVFGEHPIDDYFRAKSEDSHDQFKHLNRVVSLAEILYHFQEIDGIDKRLDEIRESNVESTVGELEGAKLLYTGGIRFRFRVPTGRLSDDFDVEAEPSTNFKVNCEMKCKLETTDLSKSTILSTLRKARSQLPKDQAGIVFVRIPEAWTKQPRLANIVHDALERFFRGTTRVAAVIFHWEEWYFDQRPTARAWRFRTELNPLSPFSTQVSAGITDNFKTRQVGANWEYFHLFL